MLTNLKILVRRKPFNQKMFRKPKLLNNSHQNPSLTIINQPVLKLSRKMYKQYRNNRPHKKKAISLRNPYHPIKHPSNKNLKKQLVMLSGTAPSARSQVGQSPQVML